MRSIESGAAWDSGNVREVGGSSGLDELLGPQRVLPLVEAEDVEAAVHLARVLVDHGLPVMEIALRTDAALPAIETVRAAVPEAVVGAGTVLAVADLTRAIVAGAAFAVSPGATPALLAAAETGAVPFVPGIATASELMRVTEAGFREVKCFPASAMGGPDGIASLASVAPMVRTMPTGGIDAGSAVAYLRVPGSSPSRGVGCVPAN